jgi:hypothetical protein
LHELADRYGADEIMIVPAAAAYPDDDLRRYPARERTLELVADAV